MRLKLEAPTLAAGAMHVLFVHQNFPAQFGHIAAHLAQAARLPLHVRLREARPARSADIECIQYKIDGGATEHNHYCSRTFENATRHARPSTTRSRPGRTSSPTWSSATPGFGSTLFLRELYPDCRSSTTSSTSTGPGTPTWTSARTSRRSRSTASGPAPATPWSCSTWTTATPATARPTGSASLFPKEFQHKLRTIFDGVDTAVWKPMPDLPRTVNGVRDVPEGMKVVTYATRGMESMRGFDVFMKAAKKLCDRRTDVIFLIAGQDRVCYGGDERFTGGKSVQGVGARRRTTTTCRRFVFLGLIPPTELAKLFNITDVHVYLTVPFVLSWSLLDALACGATVLASDTAPVREMIQTGVNGVLFDFFNVDALAELANQLLDRQAEYQVAGPAGGGDHPRDRYSIDVCLPKMVEMYESVKRRA